MKKNMILEKFSSNLRRIRETKNITQSEMADLLDIDIRTYQRYESSKPPNIKLTSLVNIANKLNITITELIK